MTIPLTFSARPLPPSLLAYASAFFNEDLSGVRVQAGGLALALGARACASGALLDFAPGMYQPGSDEGLALIGHELTHIVQQRRGDARLARHAGPVLADAALEAEADALGAQLLSFVRNRPLPPHARAVAGTAWAPAGPSPIQCQAWLRTHEKKPLDEYFWHATTTANVRRIFESNLIKPSMGGGGNGPGFYVAPSVTDYIKVMAYRNLKPGDWDSMFILKILARDFYAMKGFFSDDGLAGNVDHDVGDFVAARWSLEIAGDTSYRDPEGKMTRYDQYQGKPLPTTGFKDGVKQFTGAGNWREKAAARKKALDELWACAQTNVIRTDNPELHDLMTAVGPRAAFLQTIEEITFKNSAGPFLHVVGARRYHTNDKPNDGLYAGDVECDLQHLEDVISLD